MNSKFFNLILDGRGRIRTARNNGDERGLSLRNRRAWYAEEPPPTPADTTPEKPAPEPNKSGADDSGEGSSLPDWVKDPAKAYEAIQKLRVESAENRTKAANLQAEKDREAQEQDKAKKKKLAEDGDWQKLAEEARKEVEETKAESERTIQGLMRKLIGKEFNLPEKLVARLQGATEDELRADAADLAKDLGLDKKQAESEKPAETKQPEPEAQAARGQTTTTAVPGGQAVGRTDADRRKDYIDGSNSSPIFQGGKLVINGKGDLD